MISIFQFIVLHGGYYYKCHCLYIFMIHFLFSFTQSYRLHIVLSIDHHYFSFIYLSIVAVGAFVLVCGCCWCFCARLGFGSVPLFPGSVVVVLIWGLDRCLCLLVLYSLLVLLCSSFGAPVLFQAAPDAVLLWSGCCPWSVCLSVVATGALVVSVVAASASVVALVDIGTFPSLSLTNM